jgi:hypothetical protein
MENAGGRWTEFDGESERLGNSPYVSRLSSGTTIARSTWPAAPVRCAEQPLALGAL